MASADLKRLLDADDDIVVLDARESGDYSGAGGHIPGAKNIPLADVQSRVGELESRRQRPLAVVCRTNKMSIQAAERLRSDVFNQDLIVEDGMIGWAANGFTTE